MADFDELPKGHFGAILADPPWAFKLYGRTGNSARNGLPQKADADHYEVMDESALSAIPIVDLAADNCVLFIWVTWPTIYWALRVIEAWGFQYKTCAFNWIKANATQIEMFREDYDTHIGLGFWTRSNSEVCLLATKGKPKRLNADIRQAIIEPRRQHSRKPDGIHERIERLVAGPYLELFARQQRPGWTVWGNETNKFKPQPAPDWDSMWQKPFDKPELVWGKK